MVSVELRDVCKVIRRNTVVDHMNLTMTGGRVVGLKGINGSGKTMTMRLICGLIRPTSGEICINGRRLGHELTFPESIGVLLENPAFLDNFSGFENLKLLASIKGLVSDEQLCDTLRRVGLEADKKAYRKYSLGMKQRLGVAAAVMEQPDIVVLDEPTNSLDSDGVEMVRQIVAEEKQRGALVILTCHDFETLRMLSDEIYTIERGRIVAHWPEAETV